MSNWLQSCWLRLLAGAFCLLILPRSAAAQERVQGWVDVAGISSYQQVTGETRVAFISPGEFLPEVYAGLRFDTIERLMIPSDRVTHKAITRVQLYNSGDSAVSVWFFPGYYYWDAILYGEGPAGLRRLPVEMPGDSRLVSYRKIRLAAHDSLVMVAELHFAKTYLNSIRPRLIHANYLEGFIYEMGATRLPTNVLTYIFCGLFLMLLLYSLANFFQGGNPEFLYYSGFAFFIGLMLLIKAMHNFSSTKMALFQDEYLDFVLQDIGYLFYMAFMQRYLETRSRHPILFHLYRWGIVLTVVSALAYTYLHYFTDQFVLENGVENWTKYLLLGLSLTFLIYSLRYWQDRLLRYLFWGNFCLLVFSVISQLGILAENLLSHLPGVFQSSLFLYELGVFGELLFFLIALNHKTRRELVEQARDRERLRAENQMKEYEKELAVFKAQQQERERISADMHDELGSGMTAIRLMSEIARNRMKKEAPPEIEKISQSANEILNKMNAIIWSMNSGNDTIDNLVSYIRVYAQEYFDGTPIDCRVTVPAEIPHTELSGDRRRNLFLCVKETLNNVLKHSGASRLSIEFGFGEALEIRIADNGVGIDKEKTRLFGNGLKNIARRMESIGGSYAIENHSGTVTTLTLPL